MLIIKGLLALLFFSQGLLAATTPNLGPCIEALAGDEVVAKGASVHGVGEIPWLSQLLSQTYAVHATSFFPYGGVLRSGWGRGSSSITIHFSIGGLVPPHEAGNWDEKPFAILAPVADVLSGAVNFFAQDTAYLGDFELPPGAIVLVPEDFAFPQESFHFSVVRYKGKLKAAVEHLFKMQNLRSVEMAAFSGIDGDHAFFEGHDVNSPEMFSIIQSRFPHLLRQSAMENEWHKTATLLVVLQRELADHLKNYPLDPAIITNIQIAAKRRIRELMTKAQDRVFRRPENQLLILARLDQLQKQFAEFESHSIESGSNFLWFFDEATVLNEDLNSQEYERQLRESGFSSRDSVRSFLLANAIVHYLSLGTSAKKADQEFSYIEDLLGEIADLDDEQALYGFPDSMLLVKAARIGLRDHQIPARMERLLNLSVFEKKVRRALASLDNQGAHAIYPISFAELAKGFKSQRR